MFKHFLFSILFSVITFGQIPWNNFSEGIESASSQNKKIIINIYTDWTSWCKKMERDVYSQDNIMQYISKNFVPIKMDAESNNDILFADKNYTEATLIEEEFGIDGYPSTVFLSSSGEIITVVPGYVGAEEFLLMLKYINEDAYLKQEWEEYVNK